MPFLLNIFSRIERKGTLPNLFYEAIITLIPKSVRELQEKANIHYNYGCKY